MPEAFPIPQWLTRDIDPVGVYQKSVQLVNQDMQERERIKQAREEAAARASIAFAQMANQAQMQQAAQQARQRGQEREIKAGVEQEAGRLRFAQEGEKRKAQELDRRFQFDEKSAADKMRMLEGADQRRSKEAADRLTLGRDNLSLRQEAEKRRAETQPTTATRLTPQETIQKDLLMSEVSQLRTARQYITDPKEQVDWDSKWNAATNALSKIGVSKPQGEAPQSTQGNATIKARVVMANELERSNPNWTKQQIIDEVKRMIP